MSLQKLTSFIDFTPLSRDQIRAILKTAQHFSQSTATVKDFGRTGAFLFFEPSTRTRMSFQIAASRLGVANCLLEGKAGTSLEKGETIEDTILNVAAMAPDFMVIRVGAQVDLPALAQELKVPIINAGWGATAHPTQALLDVLTIEQDLGNIEGKKVLIVGDIRHSRVAASHMQLAQKLNYQVGVCGPDFFLGDVDSSVQVFKDLSTALQWADVVMALRVQLERHEQQFDMQTYRDQYAVVGSRLEEIASKAVILHPGPINFGVELDRSVLQDPRTRIFQQVSYGVHVRQSLIYHILGS